MSYIDLKRLKSPSQRLDSFLPFGRSPAEVSAPLSYLLGVHNQPSAWLPAAFGAHMSSPREDRRSEGKGSRALPSRSLPLPELGRDDGWGARPGWRSSQSRHSRTRGGAQRCAVDPGPRAECGAFSGRRSRLSLRRRSGTASGVGLFFRIAVPALAALGRDDR
jgi:hypothetical protein